MKHFIDRITSWQRKLIFILLDSSIIGISFLGSLFAFNYLEISKAHIWIIPFVIFVKITCFLLSGMYSVLWRFATINEALSVIKAITLGDLILGLMFWTGVPAPLTIEVLIFDWMLSICLIGGNRFAFRLYRDYLYQAQLSGAVKNTTKRLVIIGAGRAGEIVAREVQRTPSLGYKVVGFVDDNVKLLGHSIHQFPVLGNTDSLSQLVDEHDIDEALLVIPSAGGEAIKTIVEKCRAVGLPHRITPGIFELIDGRVSVNQIRDVQIEDLLGRKVVKGDRGETAQFIAGKTVLITGAGGSIGSEIARQIYRLNPRKLILLDQAETPLYQIDMELREMDRLSPLVPVVADVQDLNRLRVIFSEHAPEVVFHAAAYKHVPMMEFNPQEVISNNIIGTQNVIQLSHDCEVASFVLISTDKAVHPTNVMGASKRVCELLMLQKAKSSKTKFSAVRFGNVLGSNGSVVPLFRKQIQEGGPITVTHAEVTRYFMTIPEAVSLVLRAGSSAQGGELFVLDMGQPVKILNLAKEMIVLSGLQVDKDIKIKITGLRPGEKLHEELFFDKEHLNATTNDKIFIAPPIQINEEKLNDSIEKLVQIAQTENPLKIREFLLQFIQGFTPDYEKPCGN